MFFAGIWADDSDNEESNEKPYKSRKQPKNYTASIGFVAGGIQQAGKKEKDSNKDTKDEPESDDEKPSFKGRDSSEESEDEKPRAGELFNHLSNLSLSSHCMDYVLMVTCF